MLKDNIRKALKDERIRLFLILAIGAVILYLLNLRKPINYILYQLPEEAAASVVKFVILTTATPDSPAYIEGSKFMVTSYLPLAVLEAIDTFTFYIVILLELLFIPIIICGIKNLVLNWIKNNSTAKKVDNVAAKLKITTLERKLLVLFILFYLFVTLIPITAPKEYQNVPKGMIGQLLNSPNCEHYPWLSAWYCHLFRITHDMSQGVNRFFFPLTLFAMWILIVSYLFVDRKIKNW